MCYLSNTAPIIGWWRHTGWMDSLFTFHRIFPRADSFHLFLSWWAHPTTLAFFSFSQSIFSRHILIRTMKMCWDDGVLSQWNLKVYILQMKHWKLGGRKGQMATPAGCMAVIVKVKGWPWQCEDVHWKSWVHAVLQVCPSIVRDSRPGELQDPRRASPREQP